MMINLRIGRRDALLVGCGLLFSIALGFIAGYRPFGFGRDFSSYAFFYDRIGVGDDFSYYRFEPGFVWLASFSKNWLDVPYMTFAAGLAAASLLIKAYSIRRLEHPFLAITFYIVCWFPLYENTQIRAAFAIALLFLATNYLLEQRWMVFIGLSALASTFHTTALFGAVVLSGAYWLSNYRLPVGIIVIASFGAMIAAIRDWIFPYLVRLNTLLEIGDIDSAEPNVFSAVNIVTFMFLAFSAVSGSLTSRRSRTFFLVSCAGLSVFLGFLSTPVLAHRLKEMLLVFSTFIAFEYRITNRTIPQAVLAIALAAGSLYLAIVSGYFSD